MFDKVVDLKLVIQEFVILHQHLYGFSRGRRSVYSSIHISSLWKWEKTNRVWMKLSVRRNVKYCALHGQWKSFTDLMTRTIIQQQRHFMKALFINICLVTVNEKCFRRTSRESGSNFWIKYHFYPFFLNIAKVLLLFPSQCTPSEYSIFKWVRCHYNNNTVSGMHVFFFFFFSLRDLIPNAPYYKRHTLKGLPQGNSNSIIKRMRLLQISPRNKNISYEC